MPLQICAVLHRMSAAPRGEGKLVCMMSLLHALTKQSTAWQWLAFRRLLPKRLLLDLVALFHVIGLHPVLTSCCT